MAVALIQGMSVISNVMVHLKTFSGDANITDTHS